MTAPETMAVVEALSARGATVRFVGGCVRDAALGRPVTDVDIASPDPPEEVIPLIEAAGLRAVPTGIAHGTVTAISSGRPYEITTLRRDVETYGRHAKVAFTDDWVEDAGRRDFTFNAMFCDVDGTLYDPFGGLADLHAGRVRFVGEARTRIEEDVLRLLRFFRFYAHYGRPPPDPEALVACAQMAPRLPDLSGERVRTETFKLLAAPDPMPAVELLAKHGIFRHFLPEAAGQTEFSVLARLVEIERRLARAEPVCRLAALVGAETDDAEPIRDRLRLSNADTTRFQALLRPTVVVDAEMGAPAARRTLYCLDAGPFRDLVLLAWAGDPTAGLDLDAPYAGLLALSEDWRPPTFPLAGRDVVALGVPRGPRVGELLAAVEDWWVEGDFSADREQALDRLQKLAGESAAGANGET